MYTANCEIWRGKCNGVGPITKVEGIQKWKEERLIKILSRHLLPYMQSMGSSYVFMDDNTPCHRSQAVIRWLKSKGLKQMEVWPPQSPDLNPIEHVWDILEAKLECYKPKNLRELEERIKEEWSKYRLLVCKILFQVCHITQLPLSRLRVESHNR